MKIYDGGNECRRLKKITTSKVFNEIIDGTKTIQDWFDSLVLKEMERPRVGGGEPSMEAIKEKEIQNGKNKIFGAINNQYDHKSFM